VAPMTDSDVPSIVTLPAILEVVICAIAVNETANSNVIRKINLFCIKNKIGINLMKLILFAVQN
jgi:hypothetical protein